MDVIIVSREAIAVGLHAMYGQHPMPLASGDDVEALAQRLEEDPITYHTANQATVVFLALHTEEGYFAIPVRVISRAAGSGQSIAMLCRSTWRSSAVMLHFGTTTGFSDPLIRTVMHGGPARCRLHYMLRVPAPISGCLKFHTFHSKRETSDCVETLTPPPIL